MTLRFSNSYSRNRTHICTMHRHQVYSRFKSQLVLHYDIKQKSKNQIKTRELRATIPHVELKIVEMHFTSATTIKRLTANIFETKNRLYVSHQISLKTRISSIRGVSAQILSKINRYHFGADNRGHEDTPIWKRAHRDDENSLNQSPAPSSTDR